MYPASLDRKIAGLKDRSTSLQKARSFFYERGVYEVDCPALSPRASVDEHIDLIETIDGKYLFSSPEYGMKRLLAHGSGDIFQLSHVYRNEEEGFKHQPEFMMAEWYRLGFSFEEMIKETIDFIRLFVGPIDVMTKTYQELFLDLAGLDPFLADIPSLIDYLFEKQIDTPHSIHDDKDALLNLILAIDIEPRLPDCLFVLTHYPASQAALAKKVRSNSDCEVAERFEVYYKGLELANGYHELADSEEQRQRFNESNQLRIKGGKKPLPIDEDFLAALEIGLPECSGVAVGFDRLMMIRLKKNQIDDVIAISSREYSY